MMKKIMLLLVLSSAVVATAFAGGDPEFVGFPDGYKESDTQYATINRQNGKQVGVLYANEAAVGSIKYGDKLIPGSRVIMEVYKIKKDSDGNLIKGSDGIYQKGDLAAIAVMEKSIEWPDSFPAAHRSGDWGLAIYDPKGNPKKNDLDCASCHVPLTDGDHLFSHARLKAVNN